MESLVRHNRRSRDEVLRLATRQCPDDLLPGRAVFVPTDQQRPLRMRMAAASRRQHRYAPLPAGEDQSDPVFLLHLEVVQRFFVRGDDDDVIMVAVATLQLVLERLLRRGLVDHDEDARARCGACVVVHCDPISRFYETGRTSSRSSALRHLVCARHTSIRELDWISAARSSRGTPRRLAICLRVARLSAPRLRACRSG